MIRTSRCHLELLTENDFDALLEMFLEPEAFKYIAPLKDKNKAFYIRFLERKLLEMKSQQAYYWVIKDISTKAIMGAINLTPIPNTEKMQIGWQLKKNYQRKGLALEAANAAFQFAISETSINPIYAVFELGNVASKKIIKQLGFKKLDERNEDNITIETHIYSRV